jgi:glutamate-1-semialdehyde 2,1-aminomutase
MTGHSPDVVANAIAKQVREGITLMLPTEDSIWVADELKRRFGLAYWQFALTATDANRFAIRIAREITQR